MSHSSAIATIRNHAPVIAPSMLKCDFGNLQREVELLAQAKAQVLHWDVMDGHFVPNLSYGAMVIERVRDMTEMVFDAHLMVTDPQDYLDSYIKAGCDAITFHFESNAEAADLLKRIRDEGAAAGLALNPGTSVDEIEPLLPLCDLVLVMSVQPGFGGQAFMPSSLEKLKRLREMTGPETVLSVDGGIAPDTIGDTSEAGADLFVVGSAVFDTPNYVQAISDLHSIASQRGSRAARPSDAEPVSSSVER
ncbi:MAG: ribulose-phosphate 3-epimerase [Planctomycetaceae bacterium]|nr:ribulose-phosphate 3-epimerase [Planctomycetaceae bacterium]